MFDSDSQNLCLAKGFVPRILEPKMQYFLTPCLILAQLMVIFSLFHIFTRDLTCISINVDLEPGAASTWRRPFVYIPATVPPYSLTYLLRKMKQIMTSYILI